MIHMDDVTVLRQTTTHTTPAYCWTGDEVKTTLRIYCR